MVMPQFIAAGLQLGDLFFRLVQIMRDVDFWIQSEELLPEEHSISVFRH